MDDCVWVIEFWSDIDTFRVGPFDSCDKAQDWVDKHNLKLSYCFLHVHTIDGEGAKELIERFS